ncbi:MAG TPA: DNA topoisomerase III [Chthoniobacterales bacterium]|jgi:DNA topoisomerase-3
MGKTLIIAEKPSVAGDIAKVLGKLQRESDWFENDEYVVSSAVGHLLELCAPEGVEVKRGKWSLVNLPVLPDEFALRPIEKTTSRLNVLKRLIKRKDIDLIINACDAGREGELIFRNIVTASGTNKPTQRLWLQSMTPGAIQEAFAKLRSETQMQPLADAAVSRSESDWLVGINSTRALTAFNSKIGGFQKTTAGRVQTPTLAILVEREEKIRNFKERPYFEVFGDFGVAAGSYRGRWFDPTFKKGGDEEGKAERIWTRDQAETISAKCTGKMGTIEEEKKPSSQIAPQLYDLTTLQREANSRFGLPATRTLQIAQALYERHKVLTYPRTDSRYLPEDYIGNVKSVFGSFEARDLSAHAEKALKSGWVHPNKRIFNNAKVSDHFAIVPTGNSPKGLDDLQMKIYEMVSRRLIAVFYPAAQFEITNRVTTVEGEKFKTDGKIIVDPGWMAVYGKEAESEKTGDEENSKALVPVRPGETADVERIEVRENMTRPPARYNEATLLSAMEGAGKLIDDDELREAMREKGLGTPATRASIIEGLLYEGYLERRGRELIATSKGISVITLLKNLKADVLTKPELTGEWEFRLKEMEAGRLSRTEFMSGIRHLTQDLVDKVKGFGDETVHGTYLTLDVVCPKCGGGPYKEDYRTWTCQSCQLRIWKGVAGREFEPKEVAQLLTERRVGPLEGFVSKMGRKFAASIILDEECKATFDFPKADADAAPDLTTATLLGETELGKIYETETNYLCVPEKEGEKPIRMGKQILQQNIPAEQAVKIFRDGKTDLFKRFISKKGKPFSAFLKLEGAKVGFEFEERKARPVKPRDLSTAALKSTAARKTSPAPAKAAAKPRAKAKPKTTTAKS